MFFLYPLKIDQVDGHLQRPPMTPFSPRCVNLRLPFPFFVHSFGLLRLRLVVLPLFECFGSAGSALRGGTERSNFRTSRPLFKAPLTKFLSFVNGCESGHFFFLPHPFPQLLTPPSPIVGFNFLPPQDGNSRVFFLLPPQFASSEATEHG